MSDASIAESQRRRKAYMLAKALKDAGITADMARQMNRENWKQAAAIVGVNDPSPDTIAATIERLERIDAWDELRAALAALVEAYDERPRFISQAEWNRARLALERTER